jgi:hypothetical protein
MSSSCGSYTSCAECTTSACEWASGSTCQARTYTVACLTSCSGGGSAASQLGCQARRSNCPISSSDNCPTNAAGQTNWAAVIVPIVLVAVIALYAYCWCQKIKQLCGCDTHAAVQPGAEVAEPEAPPPQQPQASPVKHTYAPAAAAPPPPHYAPAAPPTWDPVLDPGSGRTYYVNSKTFETSWAPPAALSLRAAPPAVWSAHADPMGRTYFANAQTGETRWERPY